MRVLSASTGLLQPARRAGDQQTRPDDAPGDGDATGERDHRVQFDAGLDLVAADPPGREQLLAGPLADHPATRPGDPVRYPYADRSNRPPVVTDALAPDDSGAIADAVADAAATLRTLDADPGNRLQPVLPGPYTLAGLVRDEHHRDHADLLDAVAGFLAAGVRALPPVGVVALLEPRLVADPPDDGTDGRASAAIDAVAAAVDAPVVVHCPGGALDEKVHAHLLDADLAAVGYDFTADHDASLALVAEYGTADAIGLGVVDARDPAVESAATVTERLDWVLDSLPPVMAFDAAYVTPGDALHRLPRAAAVGKLRALGEAVAGRPTDQ